MKITVYQRIKPYIDDNRISLNALAKTLNMNQSTVLRQVKGEQTLQTLQRLRVGTERVRSWYGASLVLVEELINESHCIILLLVYNLGINLGGGDSCMPHQLTGSVDVCTQC